MEALGLPHEVDAADSPFFGRGGTAPAGGGREQRLKFEMLVLVNDDAPSTACVGFGLERLALALLRHHGLSPAHWPSRVVEALWPAGGRA